MDTILTFLIFIILTIITCFGAMKLSDTAEEFEQNSNIKPMIIGIILAVATSLPEFATSLTSSIILNNPNASIANPIGSNMFNLVVLSVLLIIFQKKIQKNSISKKQNVLNTIVILMYFLALAEIFFEKNNQFILGISNNNLITFIFVILYIIGIKLSSTQEKENDEKKVDKSRIKKIILKFLMFSLIVLISSFCLSLVAEKIIKITGLESGFVGAVFLGISTSLPECVSSLVLFKKGLYNIAAANIVGSNLFNFIIVSINDIVYNKPIWNNVTDLDLYLFYFGIIMSILTWFIIQMYNPKNIVIKIFVPIGVIGLYISYLLISI